MQLKYLHEEANRVLCAEMLKRAVAVGLGPPHRQASRGKKCMVVLRHTTPNETSKMGKTSVLFG